MTRLSGVQAGGLALTLWLVSAAALAQVKVLESTGVAADVLACAALDEDSERLACFDGVAGALAQEREGPVSQPTDAESADSFGAEMLTRTVREPNPVDTIASTIVALRHQPRGERVFTLANGQIWREISAGKGRYDVGMPVRIDRTRLGAYILSTDSGGATRVRRLE